MKEVVLKLFEADIARLERELTDIRKKIAGYLKGFGI